MFLYFIYDILATRDIKRKRNMGHNEKQLSEDLERSRQGLITLFKYMSSQQDDPDNTGDIEEALEHSIENFEDFLRKTHATQIEIDDNVNSEIWIKIIRKNPNLIIPLFPEDKEEDKQISKACTENEAKAREILLQFANEQIDAEDGDLTRRIPVLITIMQCELIDRSISATTAEEEETIMECYNYFNNSNLRAARLYPQLFISE